MLQFPNTLPLGIMWPNIDPIRIVLLLTETALIIFGFHLAFNFFKKYRTLHDTLRGSRMHAAWGWLFLAYAITQTLYIFSDYYALDTVTRDFYISLGYASLTTGFLFFTFNVEWIGVIKSYHLFTIVFSALYVVMITLLVLFIFNLVSFDFVQTVSSFPWILVIPLFLIYTIRVYVLVRGKMRVYAILMIIGIVMLCLGFIGTTDYAIKHLGGLSIRLAADLSAIIGISMLSLFFSRLPSWREIEWRVALKTMFVIYRGGITIYQHDFEMELDTINQAAMMKIGGALEMVQSVLGQVTSGNLRVLDFQDKKILVEQGDSITVVMIAANESESIRFLTHEFRVRFEQFFQSILDDWPGDTNDFAPAKALVKEVFS